MEIFFFRLKNKRIQHLRAYVSVHINSEQQNCTHYNAVDEGSTAFIRKLKNENKCTQYLTINNKKLFLISIKAWPGYVEIYIFLLAVCWNTLRVLIARPT